MEHCFRSKENSFVDERADEYFWSSQAPSDAAEVAHWARHTVVCRPTCIIRTEEPAICQPLCQLPASQLKGSVPNEAHSVALHTV